MLFADGTSARHWDLIAAHNRLAPPSGSVQMLWTMDSINVDRTHIYGGLYKLSRKLGEGVFAHVYEGVNVRTGEKVAVKIQPEKTPELKREFYVYKALQKGDPAGIPKCKWYGREMGLEILVLSLLGPTVMSLLYEDAFSVKTVAMLTIQMVRRLEHIHKCGFVHNDLTLNNFLLGASAEGEDSSTLFLIDFGRVKVSSLKPQKLKPLEQDLYFNHPSSPTEDLKKLESLVDLMRTFDECQFNISSDLLLSAQPHVPKELEFHLFHEYCLNLESDQVPDYKYICELFMNLLKRLNHKCDFVFDWANKKKGDTKN